MSEFTSPAVQAMNLIRYIGDEVSKAGELIKFRILGTISEALSEAFYEDFPRQDEVSPSSGSIQSIIGAPTGDFAIQLVKELEDQGILRIESASDMPGGGTDFFGVNLSLDGWERYEAEKRGQFEGNYGFIAMQFGDPELDPFVKEVVKPAVKEGVGYDLVDMRDVGRAGVIDNIMRTQIRDAAFVIVDLTHDNSGAYWEAGYAEGLGKPVLYICEKTKFDEQKPHFDTNHCTTVLWSRNDDGGFRQELIATLRRSLDL